MQVVKGEEIVLTCDNKVGKLEEVTTILQGKGVNIRGINAYADGSKAVFRLILSDNVRAKDILKKLGTLETNEVVIVDMPDEVGQLNSIVKKLKDAGINLTHVYGTTSKPHDSAIVIIASSNNAKALELIAS